MTGNMLKLTKLSSKAYTFNNVPKSNKASLLRIKNQFAAKNPMMPKKQKNYNENPSLNNLSNDIENLMDTFDATQVDLIMYRSDRVQEDSIKCQTPPKKQKKCNENPCINNLSNDNEKLMYTSEEDATKNHISQNLLKKCNEIPASDKGNILDTSNTTQQDSLVDTNIDDSLVQTFVVIQEDSSKCHIPPKKQKNCSENSSLKDKKELSETTVTIQEDATMDQMIPKKEKKGDANLSTCISNDRDKLHISAVNEEDAHNHSLRKKQKKISQICSFNLTSENLKATPEDISRSNTFAKKQKKNRRNPSLNNRINNNKEKLKDSLQATSDRPAKKQKEYNEYSCLKNTSTGTEKQLETYKTTVDDSNNDHTPPKKQKICSENSSLNILSNEKEKILPATVTIQDDKTKHGLSPKKQKKCDKVPQTSNISNSREKLDTCEPTLDDAHNTLLPAKKPKKYSQPSSLNISNNREKIIDNSKATVEDTNWNHRPPKKQKKCRENPNLSIGKERVLDTNEATAEDLSNDHTPLKKYKKCTENSLLNILSNEKKKALGSSETNQGGAIKNPMSSKKQKKCDEKPLTISNNREKLDTSEATRGDTPPTKNPKKSRRTSSFNLSNAREKLIDINRNHILAKKQRKYSYNSSLNNLSNDGKLIATKTELKDMNHTPKKKKKKYSHNSSINIPLNEKEKICSQNSSLSNLSNDDEKRIDSSKEEINSNTTDTCPCGDMQQNISLTKEHQPKQATHIVCSKCGQWFHTSCINLTKIQGNKLNIHKIPYTCIFCLANKFKHINSIKDKLSNIISSPEVIEENQNKESEPSILIKPNTVNDAIISDGHDELSKTVNNCEMNKEISEESTKEIEPVLLYKDDDHNNILDKLIRNLSTSNDFQNMFKQDTSKNKMIPNKEHYIWDDFY